MCLPFRNGAFDAIKSAAALRLFPCLCVLRCGGKVCTPATTQLQSSQYAGYSVSLSFLTAVRAVGKSPAEAVLATAKRVAKRKRFVSAQPQETTADGTPSDEPKSRKMHQCEHVERYVRLPSFPRIKSQNPKGGFGALWRVFLLYLSSREERWSPRRA